MALLYSNGATLGFSLQNVAFQNTIVTNCVASASNQEATGLMAGGASTPAAQTFYTGLGVVFNTTSAVAFVGGDTTMTLQVLYTMM